MALLLVPGSVSLYSWQSQRENSPSLRCELSKCDDISENVCTYNFRVLFLRARVTCLSGDPLSCCSVQNSRPELAAVQASTAMSPCLTCAWSVLTCDAGTSPG